VGTYVLREVTQPGFIQTTPPAIVTVSAGNRASSIDLLTGDAVGRSAQSLDSDSLADGGNDLAQIPAGFADSLLLGGDSGSYQIEGVSIDRQAANLTNIPDFGQQNVGLEPNAAIDQFVKTNLLIDSAIALSDSIRNVKDRQLF
jgi:serine-aspartate repeat-containing protein C/D/E